MITPVDAQFYTLVWQKLTSFGGLPWTLKIAAIVTILIGSLKVSFAQAVWKKLGPYQVLAGPVLSLILGLLTLVAGSQMVTGPALFAYLFAGAGSIILHELLDAIKSLPGIGAVYLNLINLFESFLKVPAQPAATGQVVSATVTTTTVDATVVTDNTQPPNPS